MNMLSAMATQDIIQAIEQADTAALKKLPGIGAKTAGQIILDLKGKIVVEESKPKEPKPVLMPVEQADTAALKKLPGIGAKTAGQIILDLKGKIVVEESKPKEPKPVLMPVQAEVNEALISLGYRQADIDALHLNDLGDEQMDTATMLRLALKQLAGRKKF